MTTVLPPSLEGLYDTYIYYENNFTAYDYPQGVWRKYIWIMRPGVALLHSGLPERTNYNDPYNLYVAIGSCLIAVSTLLVQAFCARTIWSSKTLSSSVKWFLLVDAGMRIEFAFYTFYTMQCTFNYACVDDTNYPFSWLLLNQIWSAITGVQDYMIFLWAFGLSFSRIFAIFFNGLHYRKVERLTVPYIGLVFVLIGGFFFSMIGKKRSTTSGTYLYMGFFFLPNIYTILINFYPSNFHYLFVSNLCYLGHTVVGLSLLLDLLTLWKIRKMKKLSSSTKSRADFKLAIMMITTHFFNALLILLAQLVSMWLTTAEPLHMWLANVPASLFPIINGYLNQLAFHFGPDHFRLTVTAFNYPFKEKSKENRVSNQRPNQAASTQNKASNETQVTRLD